MCMGNEEQARREKRIRAFLATLEEIARDAAREEAARVLQPGAMVRISGPPERKIEITQPPEPQKPGRHLSVDACNRMKAIRLLLQANDPKGALAILDDVMGW
jgi:hypothetical protein